MINQTYMTMDEYCKSDLILEQEVLKIARALGTFTSDDLHGLDLALEYHKRDKRVYGALLKSLEKQGKIEQVGYVKSKRSTCHHRPILSWRLKL
jgi:hypothetical protein